MLQFTVIGNAQKYILKPLSLEWFKKFDYSCIEQINNSLKKKLMNRVNLICPSNIRGNLPIVLISLCIGYPYKTSALLADSMEIV